ncbi:MAG: DUF2141 domain-containing protein [Catalinimonas sp.]
MIRYIFITLLSVFLGSTCAHAQDDAFVIDITKVRVNEGEVVVEIYENQDSWMKTPLTVKRMPAGTDRLKVSLPLPYGRYGVAIYQDLDGDGEIDSNWLDIPKEPIGFGNNHRPFGSPDFKDCVIDFSPGYQAQTIKLYKVF